MMFSVITKTISWKIREALLDDQAGSFTVEFVIWVPLLMTYYLTSITITNAYQIRNTASRVSSTITDILSRRREDVDANYLAGLHELQKLMLPNVPEGLSIRMSSIKYSADAPDNIEVEWSCSFSEKSTLIEDEYGIFRVLTNADLVNHDFPTIGDGESLIYVETYTPYTPVFSGLGINGDPIIYRKASLPRFLSLIKGPTLDECKSAR